MNLFKINKTCFFKLKLSFVDFELFIFAKALFLKEVILKIPKTPIVQFAFGKAASLMKS